MVSNSSAKMAEVLKSENKIKNMKTVNKISNILRSIHADHGCVDEILRHPLDYPGWSLQGLGMLRLYLTKGIRLHVWDTTRQFKDVSLIHNHPWNFTSVVLYGQVENRLYSVGTGTPFMRSKILCGPGGGKVSQPEQIFLKEYATQIIHAGEFYEQGFDEIHASYPSIGAVTVVEQFHTSDPDHAAVFWPKGTEWGSAEPRPATNEEIISICRSVKL